MHAALSDMQARFNLDALVRDGAQVDGERLLCFRALLTRLSLPVSLADALLRWQGARPAGDGGDRPARGLMPRRLERWDRLSHVPGYTPEVVRRLAPYAAVLPPDIDKVNVNTAPALLLSAMLPNVPEGVLSTVLEQRTRSYFRDVSDFRTRLGIRGDLPGLTATSSMFLLEGEVRHAAAGRKTQGLIRVEPGRIRLLWREDGPRGVVANEGES